MYDTIRQELEWFFMSNDVYAAVSEGANAYATQPKWHKRNTGNSKVMDLLLFIARYMLAQLVESTNGNQFVVIMTNQYSKFTRAVRTSKTARRI